MSTTTAPLSRWEWDFDSVSESELVACCYWEYARESASIRGIYEQAAKADFWDQTDTLNHPILHGLWRIGNRDDRHLRSGVFKRNFFINRLFPAAWQLLKAEERKRMANPRLIQPGPGFVRAGIEAAYQIIHEYDETTEKWKPVQRESVMSDYGIEWTVFEINWRDYTDQALTSDFRQWLKENRPKNLPKPKTKRGHSLKEWRANLTRLAVMRLLIHFSPLQLIDPRQRKFPAIWQTKQFAGQKWGDATKWHDARRKAREVFRKLFPFLSAAENPISWRHTTRQII